MLGSETITDDAFVSVYPVLGTSLVVSTRFLAPLTSTDCTDPLDGLIALAPNSGGSRIHGGRRHRWNHDPDVARTRCGQRLPIYGKREVAIRGRVLRVIRTPSRRAAQFLGNVEFAEVHRSEYIQQAMLFLPKLSERKQRAVAEHIKVLAERE